MFWERRLDNWVEQVRSHSALPLQLDLWNGKQLHFGKDKPQVVIRIPDVSALKYFFQPSLSNLGEAYVNGKIEVEGKAKTVIAVANALAARTLKIEGKFSRVVRSFSHGKKDDAEAIRYHYDVSNEFYGLWLDKNMVYSCAYFENGDETLDQAQQKKIDHILTKIRVRPGDTLLDIGCGWGALVIRAATRFGAKCVGVTLSERQVELARERVKQAGLEGQVEIRLQDYRDVQGSFKRITSVGMFEHVGLQNLPGYFSKINSLLDDDGVAMNHGITSTDVDSGDSPYGTGEFVDKYVFPHGELPHLSLALRSMQEGGLEVLDVENLRRHYARTCGTWVDNYEANSAAIKNTVDDKRYRIWRVYLAGCQYAFQQDWISLYQVVCAKAGRDTSHLPWSRRFMYPG
ncbi:MAG: class I SAM-dependent methyltransferase [Burkholderiaceae bacterium]|nr:class I SAM-dependent methyltransferase [Burkholderiaceae bacterium]